ncbi:MAG: hypothetical protein V1754_06900, partial [Pseudomonadota bacterium]
VLFVLTMACMVGCGPDLGESPFFCNMGSPACPDGYHCEGVGARAVCIRDGFESGDGQNNDQVVGNDAGSVKDQSNVADMFSPDKFMTQDQGQVPQDLGQKKDTSIVSDTTAHLGCQNNAECIAEDPSSPCCCPIPFLPIWGCFPLCLDPFCLGL